jgi:hypothetical protein
MNDRFGELRRSAPGRTETNNRRPTTLATDQRRTSAPPHDVVDAATRWDSRTRGR